MSSNVTPTSKRLEYAILKLDCEIEALKHKRQGMWDAKQVAEQVEADLAREAERKAKPDKEEEEKHNRKVSKPDPTRNIVDEERSERVLVGGPGIAMTEPGRMSPIRE